MGFSFFLGRGNEREGSRAESVLLVFAIVFFMCKIVDSWLRFSLVFFFLESHSPKLYPQYETRTIVMPQIGMDLVAGDL